MKNEKNVMNKTGKDVAMYAMFASWYFVGGAISTFLTGTLLVKLQANLTQVELGSLMAIAGLPWVFKPVWGLLIDRFKGMYWWAMVASVTLGYSVLALVMVHDQSPFGVIAVVVLLPNILRSLQDVAVDGLSVAMTREDQRGNVQTWMRVGTIAGTLLGGAGAMYLEQASNWFITCLALMAVSFAFGVVVPRKLAEKLDVENSRSETKASWKDFAEMFKSPILRLGLLLAVFALPAQQITYPVFFKWWSSGHYSKGMVPVIFLWGPAFQFLGALIGGLLVKKTGKLPAVIVAIAFVTTSYLAIGFNSQWSEEAVKVLSWMTALTDTIYAVALFALLMDLTDKRYTAMSFALYMAGTNLCGVWANWFGGYMSGDCAGVEGIFMLAGVAQLGVLPIVIAIHKRRTVA